MTFKELGVSEAYLKALKENNILEPTHIQQKAIPFLLSKGTDFIGQAQTGTGKTAAFGLPLLHRIDAQNKKIQALILAPTRELCQQIAKQLFRFTKYADKIFVEAVFGGEKIDIQIKSLSRPTHIVVATPGRLIDLQERNIVDLSDLKTVVLDEADEMLSMGFKKELDKILKMTGPSKNTWLFSATMPHEIRQIIKNYMTADAFQVQINKELPVNTSIEHAYVECPATDKLTVLLRFLQSQEGKSGIIFCNTKVEVRTLNGQLKTKDFAVDAIHGDLLQKERDKVMRAFKNNKVRILVATDISARGIDVQNLAYVVHYQLPDQLDYYTHRSGRTARAGKRGLSLSLVSPQELRKLQQIEEELKIAVRKHE